MKGVLLVNLGSPDSTDPKDVKRYLEEFLMDERVIDLPLWLRTFIVKGIILNTRPKKSAAAYEKIWWEEGSPLIVLSERLQEKIDHLTQVPVALAMRYGNPSIQNGLQTLYNEGVTDVLLIPLYPQFAMATTETILVKAEELRQRHFPEMQFTNVPAFYNHPDYVRVLSESIQSQLENKEWDHLLFSYHGVPERHIKKSDITKSHCKIDGQCCQTASPAHQFCYRHQCLETTRQVAAYLGLKEGTYSSSFQSRLGIDPWLQPFTDKTINKFASEGVDKLAVVTPAFVSDCIETLEEIGMEARHEFQQNGGKTFHMLACLNDDEAWVKVLSRWIDEWALSPIEK
ncbi:MULTISPECIES: ferrochelatase [Galbibacter]|uniref:Ferrochelatase n=1 Tax=Galbibacter pacificus TaxID=2996052 RepID=A0ABT6FTX3_9FLAO|nr:ferrochelatase [Galbibacter pacificus]MDG3583243.1 ferrochelatase [Galbibacter pacificus]MDG3586724.1 ferrochelatase [Galbibacter pacificus]